MVIDYEASFRVHYGEAEAADMADLIAKLMVRYSVFSESQLWGVAWSIVFLTCV